MHRTLPHTLVALLTGALLLAGASLGAASASAAPASDSGWIRAGHLSPGTPDADVALTPLSGGKPVILRDVGYQDVTDYANVPTGTYSVAFRPAGAPMSQAPMIRKSVNVGEQSATTVLATGPRKDVGVQVVYDDLTPPPAGQAKVRLISGASTDVTARVENGPLLAEEVTTGSATGYATVEAQTWTVDVRAGSADATSRVRVRDGGVYTLLALDNASGGLELAAVQDSGASGTMPSGGVDTGAGGLAADPAPALGAPGWIAVAALLLLTLGGGAAATRRSTR